MKMNTKTIAFCMFMLMLGWIAMNPEPRERNVYTLADFVDVEHGMTYTEFANLFERDVNQRWRRVLYRFNLNDGSEMSIEFSSNEFIISQNQVTIMVITDMSWRRFILNENFPFHHLGTIIEKQTDEKIFSISDFVDVRIGMPFYEVMDILSLPSKRETLSSGYTTIYINLTDNAQMGLWFSEENILLGLFIVDPIGRKFVSWSPLYTEANVLTLADIVYIEYGMKYEDFATLFNKEPNFGWGRPFYFFNLSDGSELSVRMTADSVWQAYVAIIAITDPSGRRFSLMPSENIPYIPKNTVIEVQTDEVFSIANLINVTHGMSYCEVLVELDIQLEFLFNGYTKIVLNLADNAQMELLFSGDILYGIFLIDPIGRRFVSWSQSLFAERDIFTLADLAAMEFGMTYLDFSNITGRYISTRPRGHRFTLSDGFQISLGFSNQEDEAGRNWLANMVIFDTNGRRFYLRNNWPPVSMDAVIEKQIDDELFTLLDFVNVRPHMPYSEVMRLLNIFPQMDALPNGDTLILINLIENAQKGLWFSDEDILRGIFIIDPIGRRFVTFP